MAIGANECSELPAPFGCAVSLFGDSNGTLWVGLAGGVARWKPDPAQLFPLPSLTNGYLGLTEENGAPLVGTPDGLARFVGGNVEVVHPSPAAVKPVPPSAVLRDRDGGLWVATSSRGVWHVHNGKTDVFTAADGLSGDNVFRMLEDREGNVWVATSDGLDRFRDAAVPTYLAARTFSNGVVTTLLAATDGSLWIGTLDGLNHWDRDRLTVYREQPRPQRSGSRQIVAAPFPERTASMLQDRAGRIWLSDSRSAGYLDGDRFVPVVAGDPTIPFLIDDPQRDIWISTQERLVRIHPDLTTDTIRWSDLGVSGYATAAAVDPRRGGLWLGFSDGGVAYHDGRRIERRYAEREGLGTSMVYDVRADRDGTVWAATRNGLSRIDDGRVTTVNAGRGLPCDGVHWSMPDDAGSMWLYTPCGLLRVPQNELKPATPRIEHVTLFDSADGIRLFSRPALYHPQVTKAPDGRIWFSTYDGVAVIDPRNIRVNVLPPPVHIEQVIADRKAYDATAGLRLPPRTRDLQIDYTALSLVAPEKNRFRVKLEGRDRDWQDVGTRRQAFYGDLPPGSYTFRVKGSNNRGVWNEAGASLEFSVAPAYYQTSWFRAASVAILALLLWAGYRVRVGVIERHEAQISALNERLMKAQEQERMRIAGELHDGVMQQISAFVLLLGTAKRRMKLDLDAKADVASVQQKLIELGSEVRQLSHDLHPATLKEAGLPEALRAYCAEFSQTRGIAVTCEADESGSDLSRGSALALYRIAQEALGNAAKHAAPTRIEVRLTRTKSDAVLTVTDDGVGVDAVGVGTGLGLVSMRERARQLNGTFEFASKRGRGTTVSVRIPFRPVSTPS